MQRSSYWLTRFCFQRALAFVYLFAFLIAAHQFIPLLGENGILPAVHFMDRVSFQRAPSLFWLNASDTVFLLAAWTGAGLSVLALTGLSEAFNSWVSALVWGSLWFLYLSFVNVGSLFYGFGWESLLCETGFLAIFLGASKSRPPVIVIWMLRWVLFRVMFGAGLIKIRGDECWLNLTCMDYHYETQPVPNPLSWYFHQAPSFFHRAEVLFTHFVELIVPFGYFAVQPAAALAGLLTLLFQFILILSGNLSWLNYVTMVVALSCLNDRFLKRLVPVRIPETPPIPLARKILLGALSALIIFLSIPPALNLFSKRQMMNASFDPLHLVNTYGAFGSITRSRNEVILQGTSDKQITPATEWKEYEFKCKPGDVHQRPCVMSPYHYRLDWQMWFAAMSPFTYHPWTLNLIAKLLQNDPKVLNLMAGNPFPEEPPQFIRAELYHYRFTTPEERRRSGDWWVRTRVGNYIPPLSFKNESFREVLRRQGWLKEIPAANENKR